MKTKVFLSLCLAACATMASAQFESKSSYSIYETEYGWQGLRVSYKPIVMDVKGAEDFDMNGFSIDYVKSFRIGGYTPLFLEMGAGIQTASYLNEDEEGYDGISISVEEKLTVASINVPFNLAYLCILSDQLTLTPYVGLNVKGHLLGEYSVTAKALGETEKETLDLFDEDEMYGEPFKRFIVGWQIGATFTYNRVSLGVSYGSDLTEISDDVKFATTAITLGVNF